MKPGIAVGLKTELMACCDEINVTDSKNTECYNDVDKGQRQGLFHVDWSRHGQRCTVIMGIKY